MVNPPKHILFGQLEQKNSVCKRVQPYKSNYIASCGPGTDDVKTEVKRYSLEIPSLDIYTPFKPWACCMKNCMFLTSNTVDITPFRKFIKIII